MVVSDLHATSRPPDDKAGSWITTTTLRDDRNHPLVSLPAAITASGASVDIVLCAGDITDKADATALTTTWTDLNDAAQSLDAKLIATAGNHDLDSRHGTEIDPRGVLFDLQPLFPFNDAGARAEYWSKNYCVVEGSTGDVSWRVVALNTSAFHGLSSELGDELDFGRVSARTTSRLTEELASRPRADVQILLLHHHIQQMPDVDLAEQGLVREVEGLLMLLERTGPWTAIHGHKHRPYIQYAAGGGGSAAIFSAASMAAHSFGQLSAIAGQNQVHLLEFLDPQELDMDDLGVACRFRSWTWRPGFGWVAAEAANGWPGEGGLGWRTSPQALARSVKGQLSAPGMTLNAEELMSKFPRLRFLAPTDYTHLVDELEANGVAATRSNGGDLLSVTLKSIPTSPEVGA